LTPETDIWQDTEQLPEVRINREGNFDAVLSDNTNALGTVWNNWQTTWAGEPSVVSSEVQSTSNGSWSGDPAQGGEWNAGLEITREITETPEIQTRTGVTTSVVEDFVETRNDRIVSVSIVPFMRARTIEIDATNLKPNTNHYFYFDNVDVNKFVRPQSGTYSQDGGTTVSSHCKTDGNGRLRAFFELPNNSIDKFPTGQRELRLTSSFYNLSNPASNGSAVYQAQGLLQSSQTEIVSTRNGRVVTERLQGSRSMDRRGERLNSAPFDTTAPEIIPDVPPRVNEIPQDTTPPVLIEDPVLQVPVPVIPIPPAAPVIAPLPVVTFPTPPALPPVILQDIREIGRPRFIDRVGRGSRLDRGWGDPLAQSFLCEADGGMMLTSVDVFFETKDASMPVSVEVRTMVNGYPGQTVLPFSTVTHNPSAVNTSADGSVATTFTFESPVYVEENVEYALVVYSNSNEYNMFISRMGEKDLATGQTIAGQPYAGSLFLSQNASTWTAEQTDDMKIKIKVAKFDTSKISDLRFENDALPVSSLQNNPIETYDGQTYVKVYNYLHGMYDSVGDKDNVVIAGLTGEKQNSMLTLGNITTSNATPQNGTFIDVGDGKSKFHVVVSGGTVDSVLIDEPGHDYTVGEIISITNFDQDLAGTSTLQFEVLSVGDTIGGWPIDSLNTTFTNIDNRGIDSFTIIPDVSAYNFISGYSGSENTVGGGSNATCSRNYYFDALHTMIPSIQVKNTNILCSVYTTAMSSPEGYVNGTSYVKDNTSNFITLNDNSFFASPNVVASTINEQNEMSSTKSFECQLQLASFNPNVSPCIDVGTIGCIGIANRLNNIDSSSDVPTGTTYIPSTDPEGDSNAMVYVTRKVNLKTPATSLKVIADFFRPPTTELKVMYKIIKNDEDTPLDDVGFEFFNTDGSPDNSIEQDGRNFKEYEFTANDLPEFSAFAIKIVGQGTNTSVVPLVTALRTMALA
jgi:hypothetical protein